MIAIIILIALPLIEIGVMIKVGQWIGFWPALAIVVGTMLAGGMILARSGLNSAIRVQQALARGEAPVAALLESALVGIGAVLLMLPGFLSDAVGIMLLIPPIRSALARMALRNAMFGGHVEVRRGQFEAGAYQPDEADIRRPPRADLGGGPVIEGEFERLEERPAPPGAGNQGNGQGR